MQDHPNRANPLRGHLVAALDTIEVPAGFAWKSATIEFRDDAPGWRITGIKTRRAANDSDRGLAALLLDPTKWMVACSAAFGRLRGELSAAGVSLGAGSVDCRRADLESASATFVGPHGEPVFELDVPQSTARGQLLNDALCSMMLDRLATWEQNQQRVRDLVGDLCSSRYQGDDASLVFEFGNRPPISVEAQVLGSYSEAEASWCWSWANSSYIEIDYHRVAKMRDVVFRAVGAGALWRPGFFCDERFAWLVAQLACEQMSGFGVFTRRIADGQRVYYALFG